MRGLGMTRELNVISISQPEHLLEALSNSHEDLLALLRRAALTILATSLTRGPRPHADSVETLAHVDHDTHDLIVALVLKRLTDGSELRVQPDLVDVDTLLIAEGVGPFAAVLVLGVFPFGAHALLEEVVVSLEAKFGGGRDIVLSYVAVRDLFCS